MTVYNVLKDQGSTIASFIALVGGVAAYAASVKLKRNKYIEKLSPIQYYVHHHRITPALPRARRYFSIREQINSALYYAVQRGETTAHSDGRGGCRARLPFRAYFNIIKRINYRAVHGDRQIIGLAEIKKSIHENMHNLVPSRWREKPWRSAHRRSPGSARPLGRSRVST